MNDDGSTQRSTRESGFRLLPRDRYLGWTPYVWLVYLATFLVEPVVRTSAGQGGVGLWTSTASGVVVFLFTYFRGYWESGRRLLGIIAAQVALGILYAPFNQGSLVFCIYAAAFAAQVTPRRAAVLALAGVTVATAATTWIAGVPVYYGAGATAVTLILGAANLHFAEVRRADSQLRLAQDEVRHLAAVAERERIARDLHDVLGHTLSLIVLKSELAAKLLERDPARAAGEIRDVESVSREALREVREAIGGYRASLEDETQRARSLLNAAGVEVDVHVDESAEGGADRREAVLALALREAVTNVVRHADADSCRVRVDRSGDAWTLEVEDDGRGLTAAEGGGLRGMRERVGALGGAVDIESLGSGRGTRVRVTLPSAPDPGAADVASTPAPGTADAPSTVEAP